MMTPNAGAADSCAFPCLLVRPDNGRESEWMDSFGTIVMINNDKLDDLR